MQGSARELLSDPADQGDGINRADLAALLKAELSADCWTPAKQVNNSLLEAGYTTKQIWNASNKLGVVRTKGGMDGGWYWRLPGGGALASPGVERNSPDDSKDSVPGEMESLESSTADSLAIDLIEVDL